MNARGMTHEHKTRLMLLQIEAHNEKRRALITSGIAQTQRIEGLTFAEWEAQELERRREFERELARIPTIPSRGRP